MRTWRESEIKLDRIMSRCSFVTERNQIFKNSQLKLRVFIASGLLLMGVLPEFAEGGVVFEQLGKLPANNHLNYPMGSLIQASERILFRFAFFNVRSRRQPHLIVQ